MPLSAEVFSHTCILRQSTHTSRLIFACCAGVAGPSSNSRGIAPGVCAIAVVGPGGIVRSEMLFPDDQLGALDAYGQAPKIERPAAMQHFSDAALALLCDTVESVHSSK